MTCENLRVGKFVQVGGCKVLLAQLEQLALVPCCATAQRHKHHPPPLGGGVLCHRICANPIEGGVVPRRNEERANNCKLRFSASRRTAMEISIKRGDNGYRVGDSHHRAVLTDHEIELARHLRADGMPLCVLAEKFGVSKGHMSKVCSLKLRRQGSGLRRDLSGDESHAIGEAINVAWEAFTAEVQRLADLFEITAPRVLSAGKTLAVEGIRMGVLRRGIHRRRRLLREGQFP